MSQKMIIALLALILVIVAVFFISKQRVEEPAGNVSDEMQENLSDGTDDVGTPTSADNAPEGSIHNLPVPDAVAAVKAYVAADMDVLEGKVIVQTAYEREWTDSCLGLGGPAESCLQVITPGYEVTVAAKGETRVFRTNDDGTVLREEK